MTISTDAVAVDWSAAARRARSLVRSGPVTDRAEAALLVESLRSGAARSPELVADVTGLADAAQHSSQVPVFVTDRSTWIDTNIATFEHLTADVLPPAPNAASARLAGEELGVVLPFLASRVLGQYDPFTPGSKTGHLLLVAPNVLKVQRELDLDAGDFHLWVALHEQTHALQFAAAPWLSDHLAGLVRALMSGVLDTDAAPDRMKDLVGALPKVVTSGEEDPSDPGAGPLLGAVLNPDEQRLMGQAVAIMSLLEGHADVVMDDVGPNVIPSVKQIRVAFNKRRHSPGPVEGLLRRLLGMEAKLAQYRKGAQFVRAVVDRIGHQGLNAAWQSAQNLPGEREIADPDAWIARVHG